MKKQYWYLLYKIHYIQRLIEWNLPGYCVLGNHFVRFKNLYRIYRSDGSFINTCQKCDQDKLHWGG